jgi:predicted  nucleic acid-binding Zn-ribbon protein
MEAIEALAIIILVIAIVILVYYYLLNSPETAQKLRSVVPSTADAHMDSVLGKDSDYDDLSKEEIPVEEESGSMSKRIKVKLSDIDMSSLNTDAFSNKIDAFLDEKSDQLIKDWALATTDDLEELESKFGKTTSQVDTLEKSFDEFRKSSEEFQKATEEKLADLDERIDSLENK